MPATPTSRKVLTSFGWSLFDANGLEYERWYRSAEGYDIYNDGVLPDANPWYITLPFTSSVFGNTIPGPWTRSFRMSARAAVYGVRVKMTGGSGDATFTLTINGENALAEPLVVLQNNEFVEAVLLVTPTHVYDPAQLIIGADVFGDVIIEITDGGPW